MSISNYVLPTQVIDAARAVYVYTNYKIVKDVVTQILDFSVEVIWLDVRVPGLHILIRIYYEATTWRKLSLLNKVCVDGLLLKARKTNNTFLLMIKL